MDTVAVVDFGGQYTHLIANRIRRLNVYSEIVQPEITPEKLRRYSAIIFSGGPHSVTDPNSPTVDPRILDMNIPILGICYGHQLIAKLMGGSVYSAGSAEYGRAAIRITDKNTLFAECDDTEHVWMSHGDSVEELPEGFSVLASTDDCPYAAVVHTEKRLFGIQFHPEVTDSVHGMEMLDNFLSFSGVQRDWSSKNFISEISEDIRNQCGDRKVFLLVSGGVDSTVAFALLNTVLGPDRVVGLHVDNGLMRQDESAEIMTFMKENGFDNLHIYDAEEEFLSVLAGKYSPEEKRSIIGTEFIEVKTRAQKKMGLNSDEWMIAQGTIYPDTIESAGTKNASKIKTHHNRVDVVLDLIEQGLVIEPLASLYKDEVRLVGEELGIPHNLVWRHPFPGPGLGVRCLCSPGGTENIPTHDASTVQDIADAEGYIGQILPIKSVGVQGDSRTYAHPALLCGDRNWENLDSISTRLTNSVRGVNRVVYALYIEDKAEYNLVEAYLTKERLDRLRVLDHIVTETLYATGEYDTIWQMPVVLLPLVNSAGNECAVLRPIVSREAMTARFCPLTDTAIESIIAQAKEIDGIGDIFFDLTHKPPGTIEWE
ncbi:glutamine-hydrolyzing GMP synthase [Chitinivibrio alkaliphilus]|uniref:GMP synthase (glutamine-hydrolyzing) n=1 Tax=Chitinivibrio alkaliphilus ACht1 TaxID=1313304 RepID=U7DAA3_9BACT|nr:glutamine-hydrolyzing GMP synthase [Chitinivibrio alkaliphilus]ERP32062.1 GMP synthase [Chitinivibrio alkaliphilus ACht1]